jgi:histidinol phosphatase-like PHP family hydrolase
MSDSRAPADVINSFAAGAEARLAAAGELAAAGVRDLDANVEVDLHLHSFCSDGYHSPAGRVWEAWRRSMKGIALTDHDVFDGVPEALAAGAIFGIDVVAGIEFYTDRVGTEIIAYFPMPDRFLSWYRSGQNQDRVERIRAAKQQQLDTMCRKAPEVFGRFGVDIEITDGDIETYLRGGLNSKGDISVILSLKYGDLLRERHLARDVKEIQLKFTANDDMLNEPLDVGDLDMSPDAFVRYVLEIGGLPGLSHPTELKNKEHKTNREIRDVIWRLGELGLVCVEVDGWRNVYDDETGIYQAYLFSAMVDEYNAAHPDTPLIKTNGSDDHNQPGEGLEMGKGRNGNLLLEFGRYEIVDQLRRRFGRTDRG